MSGTDTGFTVVEATIADLRAALDAGRVTSVDLVARYLNRIAAYDRHGIRLNAVPVLNPDMFAEARASDARRARGKALGPLDGIPYTAKDSYKVRGLTVAAGSPAFRDLVASDDAFTIARLREAGAVLIGLTNMPPMANGGMQRGVYGRAESPYNGDYLTAAFGSGSSNGSGTATAASFGAFGLGEETWSSGRAPASNNGLVAYTPSRGVISVRGNWPLVPTMDVVVPHTRTVDDLLAVLDVIVADDAETRGDFWRTQPWVELPAATDVRPESYAALRDVDALRGRRVGIPRMYINADAGAREPIVTRASVIDLWERARRDLEAEGAEVVEVDFPVVSNYEKDRDGAQSMVDRGIVPEGFADRELWELSMLAWHDFLDANGDPALHALADVDGPMIFPHPTGALPDRYGAYDFDVADYVTRARAEGITPLERIPTIDEGIRGLEETRRVDLEEWMDANGLDVVVFPAVADVAPADMDVNPASADLGWRNGTWVANGNLVPRHLGVPTVTVPMGVMADIGMPVGLTFAGKAYDDSALLRYASAFEATGARRIAPPRTPPLYGFGDVPARSGQDRPLEVAGTARGGGDARGEARGPEVRLTAVAGPTQAGGTVAIAIEGSVADAAAVEDIAVFVNGAAVEVTRDGDAFHASAVVHASEHEARHSEWRAPYGSLIVAVAYDSEGAAGAAWVVAGGIA
ncbi:amidase [Diaminobutyricibacter tongyongensis]|uniref:Amidase n=1 Tax=Leifsonia tongyongensis TaxID=1268043 RepID=A0A6L9XUX3_9MICO|nr:amidase [Diaminobutyricibacter tongyongensis]